MSKKLKLTKLELETKDGKKVELSIDEAKELHAQLAELFATKTTVIPSQPVIIERDRFYPPWKPVWYSNDRNDQLDKYKVLCSVEGDSGMKVSYCGDAQPQ